MLKGSVTATGEFHPVEARECFRDVPLLEYIEGRLVEIHLRRRMGAQEGCVEAQAGEGAPQPPAPNLPDPRFLRNTDRPLSARADSTLLRRSP